MKTESQFHPEKVHILVVDDDPAILNLIKSAVTRQGYQCSTALEGKSALSIIEDNHVDIVITDIMMPEMNGIELTERIKEKGYDTDVIIMTGNVADFTYEKAISEGASDFIQKPLKLQELILRIKRIVKQRELIHERKKKEEELKTAYTTLNEMLHVLMKNLYGTIHVLGAIAEKTDPYTAGHQKNVAQLAKEIAEHMNLSEDKKESIYISGIIHDVGKISIPTEILAKPGKLTDIEFAFIKEHPKIGYDILKDIQFPWPVAEIVRQHHERINGSGYPDGLRNEDIHLEAKIIAAADVVEAMSSHRPYRPALGVDKALEELKQHRGTLYDPMVVDACLELLEGKDAVSVSRDIYNKED